MSETTPQLGVHIFIDGDACPVKEEVYRVAGRYGVPITLAANSYFRVPPGVEQVVVDATPDAADDYIAENAHEKSVVITADIPLADRCLKAGAIVLGTNGKPFTENSIGAALATRALMADLRSGGDIVGGPPPFGKQDRSRFLSALDEALVRLKR